MGPNLRVGHHPEFRDALPPASSDRLDGMATEGISRQQRELEERVGRADRARLGDSREPLYGYEFKLSDGTEIKLELERDPNTGELIDEDQEFVDARNRLAILRSRERSRGSRMFNFSFRKNRGRGPGGHGYNAEDLDGIQEQYDTELSNFIARKVHANGDVKNRNQTTETVSRAIIQEQKQMSHLERNAAEMKSGNRVLNFFRNHKWLRVGAGIALGAIGSIGLATGQVEIAAPALAAGAALRGTGGYLLGRTAWDAFQGWRARRQPHDDIRMAGHNNGDFSGRLEPEAAFQRFIKLNGAEARAGSQDPRRQELARALGARLVNEYYIGELNFTGNTKPRQDRIRDQVQALYHSTINPLEEERLKSDQTQSRRRHIAGLVGGTVLAALPLTRFVGLIEVGGGGSHDVLAHGHGGHDGGSGGPAAGSAEAHHAGIPGSHGTEGPKGGSGSSSEYGTTTPEGSPQDSSGGTMAPSSPYGPGSTGTATSPEIIINGGPGNDTINFGLIHDAAVHGHNHGHGLGAHHGAAYHETYGGTTTSELHVKSGGGFISTLEDQYNLTPSQADATYHAMYHHLSGASGTYMEGSDIRISAPGDFHLSHGARADLEARLKHLHKMPAHLHEGISNAVALTDAKTGLVDPKTGGVIAPESAAHDHGYATNGGTTAPSATGEAIQGSGAKTGGISAPDGSTMTDGSTYIDGGTGSDKVHVIVPDAHTPEGRALRHLLDGNYVPDTGLQGVTPEQAAQAQAYITAYVHDGGFGHLSPKAKITAEGVIKHYINASVDHQPAGTYAQQASERLRQIWSAIGHNLDNLSVNQAQDLEEDLAIVNAG